MNAAKYSHGRGDITLTVERRLEYASVRISDAGIGITAEMLPCVFGSSCRQSRPRHTPKRDVALASPCPQFSRDAWWSVTAASDGPGRGSEFTVLLPRCRHDRSGISFCGINHLERGENEMLWTIAVILVVLWLLGIVSSYTLGGFIHILLVIAIVIISSISFKGAGVCSRRSCSISPVLNIYSMETRERDRHATL